MNLKPTVRGRLILSRELLTRAECRGLAAADPHRIAHDLVIAHDAAELAISAICEQLGRLPNRTRDCLMAYFDWLKIGVEATLYGADYFAELHKARVELQHRYLLPDPDHWKRVRETTLEHIARYSHQYLGLRLEDLAGTSGSPSAVEGPEPAPENTGNPIPEMRGNRRYDCDGRAEVRIPYAGPPSQGKILNLSLGGCYIEMDPPLDFGRRVELVLQVNRLSFRAVGKVVYSQSFHAGNGVLARYEHPGMGIQFTGLSSGGRGRLQELISELESTARVDSKP